MTGWTTREINYCLEHAHLGAATLAEILGRSVSSVATKCCREGISLRVVTTLEVCIRCGRESAYPLNAVEVCRRCELAERTRRRVMKMAERQRKLKEEEDFELAAAEREDKRVYMRQYRS